MEVLMLSRNAQNQWRHKPRNHARGIPDTPGYIALYDENDCGIFYAKTNKMQSALLEKWDEFTYFSTMPIIQEIECDIHDAMQVINRLSIDIHDDPDPHDEVLTIDEIGPDEGLERALQSHIERRNEAFWDNIDHDEVMGILESFNYSRHVPNQCHQCNNRSFCIKMEALCSKKVYLAWPVDIGECELRDTANHEVKCPVCNKSNPRIIIVNRENATHEYELWCVNCNWKQRLPFEWGYMDPEERVIVNFHGIYDNLLIDMVLSGEQDCNVLLETMMREETWVLTTRFWHIRQIERWIKENVARGVLTWNPNHFNGEGAYRGRIELVDPQHTVRPGYIMKEYRWITRPSQERVKEFVRTLINADPDHTSYREVIRRVADQFAVKIRRSDITDIVSG